MLRTPRPACGRSASGSAGLSPLSRGTAFLPLSRGEAGAMGRKAGGGRGTLRQALPALLVLLLASAAPAIGQQAEPFGTLEMIAGGLLTGADEPYTEFWDPGAGAAVRVETPFYLGRVFADVAVAPQPARAGRDVPDYLGQYVSAGWGAAVPLPFGARLTPSLRAGLYRMTFDDESLTSAVANESELAAGADLRLSVPVGGGWRLSASATVVRVLTREPIALRLVGVGVSRTLATPGWLREALR